MRKAQRQEVMGCIDSLRQAHEEIKRALKQHNKSLVQNMLNECQEFAISIGENIEKLEGEGHATAACLERYCETLYYAYRELENGEINLDKIYKSLRKQLFKVESSAKNDIHVKREVVFLPYKASMWDSLESVWKAADEDPDCDAYVIPIPYYDKNLDGSFREMHYEGNMYPDYVPIVGYKDYDFEARRPDMIFIHNPYDECNYVTSVEPQFYASNLKKYTDNLVYIPYFILGEPNLYDEAAAKEGVKNFCIVPGVFQADKVIVQSESMRKIYIKVLTEFSGNDKKQYWEDKILGLGSPKIDKISNRDDRNTDIPEMWSNIIRKPNGGRKKVILYNTGIAALLKYNERTLKKIESVFEVFRKERENIALLWRPHPLLESTLRSMRPQLLESYIVLRDQYKSQAWGIYDDTADIDRAILLSDAYYGDTSSIVQLCLKAGKPVMIQNVEVADDVREEYG